MPERLTTKNQEKPRWPLRDRLVFFQRASPHHLLVPLSGLALGTQPDSDPRRLRAYPSPRVLPQAAHRDCRSATRTSLPCPPPGRDTGSPGLQHHSAWAGSTDCRQPPAPCQRGLWPHSALVKHGLRSPSLAQAAQLLMGLQPGPVQDPPTSLEDCDHTDPQGAGLAAKPISRGSQSTGAPDGRAELLQPGTWPWIPAQLRLLLPSMCPSPAAPAVWLITASLSWPPPHILPDGQALGGPMQPAASGCQHHALQGNQPDAELGITMGLLGPCSCSGKPGAQNPQE